MFLFIKRNKDYKGIIISGIISLIVFNLFNFNYFNIKPIDKIDEQFLVIEDYNNYVILENNKLRFVYYDNNSLQKGNRIKIKGKISNLDYSNKFNKHLKTQRVNYQIKGVVIDNDHKLTFSNKCINFILKNKTGKDRALLELILFNKKNANNMQFYNLFNLYSLSFLIVISGFHINLLFKLLNKTGIIKYLLGSFYLLVLDLPLSSLKAFLYIVLKKINKKFKLYLNNFDLLSLIFISLLFVNPSSLFNLGMIYTFLFSFGIDLINNIVVKKNLKTKILKKSLIYLISIPLILLNNYQINSCSYLLTMIFTLPACILFVLSLLYLFINPLKGIFNFYIKFIELFFKFISKISVDLVFGKPSLILVSFLYIFLLLFLYFYENKFIKKSGLMLIGYISLLIFQYNIPNLDNREIVYFVDVGQGDCTALKIKNSKKVVLIDTGGNRNKDIAKQNVIPFLKENGINCIDLIIISHDDFDHCGALDSLQENFKVNEVIDDSLFKNIKIGSSVFNNLNINEFRDNDGSNVLYGNYGGINYLFTGDISSKIENKIIDENPNLNVDVLKVSHHGSKTSSSEYFISNLQPNIAIIEVGKNNKYGHPNQEVIDRLIKYNARIYKTMDNGNLKVYKNRFTNSIVIEKQKDMI